MAPRKTKQPTEHEALTAALKDLAQKLENFGNKSYPLKYVTVMHAFNAGGRMFNSNITIGESTQDKADWMMADDEGVFVKLKEVDDVVIMPWHYVKMCIQGGLTREEWEAEQKKKEEEGKKALAESAKRIPEPDAVASEGIGSLVAESEKELKEEIEEQPTRFGLRNLTLPKK
jgi:hypothetical protein